MASGTFMRVEDVAEELGISKSYAYKIVQKLNEELKAQDFCSDDMLFHLPSVFLDSVIHINRVGIHKTAESHIKVCSHHIKLFSLPQSF